MDIQWEMAMLTIRARRFIKRTDRKLNVNGQRVGFDRSKLKCYNCHKNGHFARECRLPRNQEKSRKENNRRNVTMETPTENALVAQDGIGGYDWSYQAEEEHPTNYALMAFTSSGSSSNSDSKVDSCSKSSCLESVEAKLAHYKKNEAVFEESINVLNLEVKLRDNALVENKKKLEKVEKERDELKLTLEKFQNSSKSLNNLLESQVSVKFKTGLGYNAASSTAASSAVESFVNSSEMFGKINTAGASVNTAVRPVNTAGSKTTVNHPRPISNAYKKGYSQVTRPFNKATHSRRSTRKKELLIVVEYHIARTPQQNGVAERKNRTLIEVARTISKTPYDLIRGRTSLIDFMKPFGCPVTILNTKDHLGKFDGKADEGIFRLDLRNGLDWLFDVDSLSKSMNYMPVVAGNQTIGIVGTRDNIVAGPNYSKEDAGVKPTEVDESEASNKDRKDEQDSRSEFERLLQQDKQTKHPNSTNSINTISTHVSVAGPSFTNDDPSSPVNASEAFNAFEDHLFERFSPFKNAFALPHVPNVFLIDDTGIFGNAYDDKDMGAEANLNNLETTMNVSHIPTTRIDKDHPKDKIIGDLNLAIQTRRMTKISNEHAMDLQNGKRTIGTKWVFRNKKDERGIVVRNKARLVTQGYTQEEGINYDKVFAPVARIEEIRFIRGTIDKTLFINKDKSDILLVQVYVDDIIFGSTKKTLCLEFEQMMHKRFQMSYIGELTFFLGLQVQQKEDGIFISQDKYVANILKKFNFVTVKTASTLMEPNKALVKDEEANNMDVHLYRLIDV
ncbi:putative ribonuclease H-like domain-containing protein [Tanacetum coccineum]|uniref:Ribonuclease H-like domain-containing protein n=1 Tax=Tanacetum coccineum TaxID=301880 RepID=A0ABQ5J6C8_9ASTR